MDGTSHLRTAMEEFKGMSVVLRGDMAQHKNAYFRKPSQETARTLIRAIFALIEGQTFALKQWALGQYKRRGRITAPGELALLEEVVFDLNDKGTITKRSARIRTVPNVRFALESFARSFDYPYRLDTSEPGWTALNQAITVRHRLTHPKSAKDLQVDDGEVVVAIAAAEWLHHSIMRLLIEGIRKLVSTDGKFLAELETIESEWNETSEVVRKVLMSDGTKNKNIKAAS